MARSGTLFHNGQLATQVKGWTLLGENVALGVNVDVVHNALMASPSHRSNILDPDFTSLGIGVVRHGGSLFVTQIFATFSTVVTPTREGGAASSHAQNARSLPPGAAPASPSSKPGPPKRRPAPARAKPAAIAARPVGVPAACRAASTTLARIGRPGAAHTRALTGWPGTWVAEEALLDASLDAGSAVFVGNPRRSVAAAHAAPTPRRGSIRPREPP